MAKWQELTEEFQELSPEERLEELMESAERLPPAAPSRLTAPLPESCRVKECQTPVYLWVEVHAGRVHLEAEVSPKSPTVRGLVSLVVEALEGASLSEVLSLPEDWLGELGLTESLGMTRQQGFRGVIMRIKQEVQTATGTMRNSPGIAEK
jgi:cysteine desulfuration protein SufE